MTEKDRRVFMFRGQEAHMFSSPEEVPEGEGWQDAPYELAEEMPKKKRGRKSDAVAETGEHGDSD